MSRHDNPYDYAEHRAERAERDEARAQRREDEFTERMQLARFEAPEMTMRSIIADDGEAYELNDPKHPGWLELQLDRADNLKDEQK